MSQMMGTESKGDSSDVPRIPIQFLLNPIPVSITTLSTQMSPSLCRSMSYHDSSSARTSLPPTTNGTSDHDSTTVRNRLSQNICARTPSSLPPLAPKQRGTEIEVVNMNRRLYYIRQPRLKYEEDEIAFLHQQRSELRGSWRKVQQNYNRKFPKRQREGIQGIQCKFYRSQKRMS